MYEWIHAITIIYSLIYILLPNTTRFWDMIFILYNIVLLLSWYIYNGECAISYYDKQLHIKNYTIGQDVMNISDIHKIVPTVSEYQIERFFDALQIWKITSMIIIQQRSRILPDDLFYIFLIIYIVYILYLRHFYNESLYKKIKLDDVSEIVLKYMCMMFSIYCIKLII